MGRQIEPELTAWYQVRRAARQKLKAALASGDFSQVPTSIYGDVSKDVETPYPLSVDMETKLLAEMRNLTSTTMTADDSISITLQVNKLESFRRAYLSQKQTKLDMVRHRLQKVQHEDRYDDLMLQQFTATDKVLEQ